MSDFLKDYLVRNGYNPKQIIVATVPSYTKVQEEEVVETSPFKSNEEIAGIVDNPTFTVNVDFNNLNNAADVPTNVSDNGMRAASIKLTEEQTEVVRKLVDFLEAPIKVSRTAVIAAPAGTGKTTCLAQVIPNMNGTVIAATVAHSAKNVLKTMLADTESNSQESNVMTIASLLAMREKYDSTTNELRFMPDLKKSIIGTADILIIDECSQITEEYYEYIVDNASPSCKIIFLGDPYQLPPIEDSNNKKGKKPNISTSVVFQRADVKLTLNKVIRFTNSISKLAVDARHEIDNACKMLKANKNFLLNYQQDWNEKEGGFKFINNMPNMIKIVRNKLEEEPDNPNACKIIAYTNEMVKGMNKRLREDIWGDEAKDNVIIKGERLTIRTNFYKQDETDGSMKLYISNGQQIIIKSVIPSHITFNLSDTNAFDKEVIDALFGYVSFDHKLVIKCYEITCIDDQGKFKDKVMLADPNFEDSFTSIITKLRKVTQTFYTTYGQSHWDFFMMVRDCVLKFDYSYAITSHLAQGMSINNVILVEKDILGLNLAKDPRHVSDILKMFYVGISRAKKTLYILNGGRTDDESCDS